MTLRGAVKAVIIAALLAGAAWYALPYWPAGPWRDAAEDLKARYSVLASLTARPRSGSPGAPAPAVRIMPVSVGKAERGPMPVRFDTIGTVQAIASVTVRSRVESQILEVGFDDGAMIKAGDLLFRLDSRAIEAQIRQAEATLSRSRAQLEQAQRDVKRQEQLAANEFASKQRLDDARTSVETLAAQIRGDEAALDNLKVQLSYYTIRAPVGGRAGVAGLKAGNIVKTGDATGPLATIVQITPIYVAFAVPQRLLPEIRAAMAQGTARVTATPQGSAESAEGRIAVIDNTVDAQSGTITLRAIFDNSGDLLWPGALCNVRVVLRVEPRAVSVPSEAVQPGQSGTFVFVVSDGVARVRPVTVARAIDGRSVISSGLEGGETVVTDGQLLLNEGSKVEPRQRPDGKSPATPAAGADPAAPSRRPG